MCQTLIAQDQLVIFRALCRDCHVKEKKKETNEPKQICSTCQ